MIQRALLELNDRSQKITETRDLAVGIFIDGGLKSAFQRIFNAKSDEMIKELEEIKIINSDNLSQLYHLIGKVLKNHPRTDDEDSILFELGIDPKLLTESFSFFDKINGFS